MEPSVSEFNPKIIPYQYEVISDIRCNYNYDKGPHEILLSGSVGSAKSLLIAHLAVTHCLDNPGAVFLLGRKSMPDLKSTILLKILEHLDGDLVQGVDYTHNETRGSITFHCTTPESKIISRSWHDKKYKKFRSIEASAGAVEELTENSNAEKEFYTEMIARIGRVKAKEHFVICATNPDSPSHWAYDYFIKGSRTNPNRHVVYSRTEDNPFLPTWYIQSLKEKYDQKMIQRLLEGKWIHIESDVIYYEYDTVKHQVLENSVHDERWPLRITYDFNIALGKPLSCALFWYDELKQTFFFFDEVVIEGTRTVQSLEEIAGRGYFDLESNPQIIIHGDASGRHSDTRSNKSDYAIIEEFLKRYTRKDKRYLEFDIDVPRANPPVRDRHNLVNGKLQNSESRISMYIDKRCTVIDEGLTKTKLKANGLFVEDDSEYYQHISTAIGYGLYAVTENSKTVAPITLR